MKLNKERISAKLSEIPTEELSFLTGFQIRRTGKISGTDFVLAFFLMMLRGHNTIGQWAASICELCRAKVAAQSVQEKLQFRHQRFAEALLGHALRRQAMQGGAKPPAGKLFQPFSRVFVEDSTCVKLPAVLAAFFPGSFSHSGDNAVARIQLRLELLSGEYAHVELQSYRDNDQKFAGHILLHLRPMDLVLRDMGYAVLKVFRDIMGLGAFFLSRLRFGTNLYDPNTGAQIDLFRTLRSARRKGMSALDIQVLAGKEEQVPVRLVAIEAPPNVAQARRRKAAKDRNKKASHSKEYMELLGWTIFITNVPVETWTPRQLLEAYGCRWHIEIVFKCWKSKFDFASLFDKKQSMTPARAVISFYLLLIWLTLFFAKWYDFFLISVYQTKGKLLSLLKFADFVKDHFEELVDSPDPLEFLDFVARYCCHDKRRRPPNTMEKLHLLNLT